MTHSHVTAPTQFVEAAGVHYAYRRFGPAQGVPLLFLQHFTGTMDSWDHPVSARLWHDTFPVDRYPPQRPASGARGRCHRVDGCTRDRQGRYQFYFATERGRAGYEAHRREFARLIWQIASPKWKFDDAAFDRTAASLENPDHVSIVIHNYRWRLGLAEGASLPMTASRIGLRAVQ